MKYPMYSPPIELATKLPKEWSKTEAETYYEWFLQNVDVRVNNFLIFLGLDDKLAPVELLRCADTKLEEMLVNDERFSTAVPNGRKLTNEGYALAADWGLLLATLLLTEGKGKISWTIPIAGSIADAASTLRGNEKKSTSQNAFWFWLARSV